jgi:hypothetical protein
MKLQVTDFAKRGAGLAWQTVGKRRSAKLKESQIIAYFRNIDYDGEIMSQAETSISEPSGRATRPVSLISVQAGSPAASIARFEPFGAEKRIA